MSCPSGLVWLLDRSPHNARKGRSFVACEPDRGGFSRAELEVQLYSTFVPYQMICPQCEQIGFVRMERVITGVYCVRAYECGRCSHAWQVTDTLQAPEAPKHTPLPKPRTRRRRPP
jgi:hypothetical protein